VKSRDGALWMLDVWHEGRGVTRRELQPLAR
jgi:hypothetical protein